MQFVGGVGAVLIIAAYFLNSRKRIEAQSKSYQLINLVGAICVAINVFYFRAWPSFALNIVWAFIAICSLYKLYKKKAV